MSSLLSAELSAACNALGYFDESSNKYYADANTLETVKDLIRYLRRDDETHEIRRKLGETKILQTDLLPLLKSYWEENDLFDVILRLVVNLSTPALILWNDEIPIDKTVRNYYLQIEDHLQSYKETFADEGVWAVLSTRLSKILELDYADRGDENSLVIERILILIRNVLYVPADTREKRPDNDASIHDQVLWALHQSGMLDIILYITSSSNEQAYYMHILEILSYMLREQNPTELANAALQRSQTEKIRDEAELLAIRHRETNQKQKKIKKYAGARHSTFGGTFVVKSMKSISENEFIYHKPLNKLDELNFDMDKIKPKTPKNRMPFISNISERRSAFTIRLFLKEFCVEFISGAYNTLMYHAKDNLVRAKSQSHDESYYLWSLKFFMEFNRSYKFEVKLVSETMSVNTFHYVQQLSENYFDLMQTDKKKLRLWSKRLHLALLAYQELFHTLCFMDKSPDGTVKDSAKVLKSNIFYMPEYREFVLTLLVNYNELKMSDVYLKDLIETQHIFIKMFESFCGGKGGSVLVQKKKARRRNKKAIAGTQSTRESQKDPKNMDLEQKWDEISQQLSIVLETGGEFLTDVPFDAASDIPIDDQKADAMIKVQRKLRNFEFENAVGLLRAAREVWPENESFGSQNMKPEEEFLALRDIFHADLGENNNIQTITQDNSPDEETDEEEEQHNEYGEIDLNFDDFIQRLPHPKIVRACGLALKNFDTNSINTNHCIVKLLHRIAFDCKMHIMVFQLSIFCTFQRIFLMKDMPQHKELVKFATFIMRQFLKVQETNKKIFMESLFFKSKKDAFEIASNYECINEKTTKSRWTEEQEDELRRLFMEHQNNNIQEDVVDWVTENLIDNTRSRRIVLNKLKELSLLIHDYKRKKSASRTRALTWGSEEESQLRDLHEEFKDAQDPLGCIMDRLEIRRPKNRIIEKMLVMGLIQDKTELRKNRIRKSKTSNSKPQLNHNSETSNTDSDNDLNEPNISSRFTNRNVIQRRKAKRTVNNQGTNFKGKNNDNNTKKNISFVPQRQQIVKSLLLNINGGRQEALEWLRESLSDVVDDFEDDNNEGIPLVPIMAYAQESMENKDFQEMLKAFGICEPTDEQESYWRIPANLTVDNLKEYCSLIQEALNKTLTSCPAETSIQEDSTSDDDNIFEKLRNINKQIDLKAKQQVNNYEEFSVSNKRTDGLAAVETNEENLTTVVNTKISVSDDNTHQDNQGGNPGLNIKKGRIRNYISADSEEELDLENSTKELNLTALTNTKISINEDNIQENQENSSQSFKKGRIRNIIDTDSEEEMGKENTNIMNTELLSDGVKRSRKISDSDSERPSFKRTRIIDSDDD